MEDNIVKLEKTISNLKERKFRYYFIMPDIPTPSSSVYEIYRHANIIKKQGFDVTILTEEIGYTKPEWITDKELLSVPHKQITSEIKVSPEDVIVIPEIFTNIMEKIRVLQCHKILLFQSLDYALHALLPGVDYYNWGIFDVITPSKGSSETFKNIFGSGYNVYNYNIGIPNYFKYNGEVKLPILSFVARNSNDINRFAKQFYLQFPYYRFLTFQDLSNLDKESFAKKLKNSFALLWIDNISTASTIPLEAMKANTIVIGQYPSIEHDYINEQNGYWSNNKLDLAPIVAHILSQYLENTTDNKMFEEMDKTVEQYTDENSETQLTYIYNDLVEKRIQEFENYLETLKNNK